MDFARQSMELADRSGDTPGLPEAGSLFSQAEQLQKKRQPEYPLHYSLAGFHYCNLLLGGCEALAWPPTGPEPGLGRVQAVVAAGRCGRGPLRRWSGPVKSEHPSSASPWATAPWAARAASRDASRKFCNISRMFLPFSQAPSSVSARFLLHALCETTLRPLRLIPVPEVAAESLQNLLRLP